MPFHEYERALNEFPADLIHQSLQGIHKHPLRGPVTSTGVTTSPIDHSVATPGVRIYDIGPDKIAFRVTVVERQGAFWDELEMPRVALDGLVRALLERLGKGGAS